MKTNIEILIPTFNKDLEEMRSIIKKANIFSDTIIRSQCGKTGVFEEIVNTFKVKYVFADDIGTSKNRNELLKLSAKEFVMFVDDDLTFNNGCGEIIENDFLFNKKSDAIEYSLEFEGKEKNLFFKQYKKNSLLKTGNHGIISIVFRRMRLIEINAEFDERFGPGTQCSCGEDTIFRHTYHKKLNDFITSSFVLGFVRNETSTWFKGKNKKYFLDRSLVYGYNHPYLYWLFLIRMKLLNMRNKEIHLLDCLKEAKHGCEMRRH